LETTVTDVAAEAAPDVDELDEVSAIPTGPVVRRVIEDEQSPAGDAETAAPRRKRYKAPAAAVVIALAGLTIFSSVTLFFGAYAFAFSGLQEQRSQHQLYSLFRGLLDPSSETIPPIGGPIAPGTPVAMMTAPAAGIHDLIVVEGTSSDQLLEGPGHLPDSPLPGQVGESVVMGRSATAGAPFGSLTRLRKGSVIVVVTGQGRFRYVVQDLRVAGDRLPRIPYEGSVLTLVTSAGSGFLGAFVPNHLVYVDARLAGKTVTSPAGRPVFVATSDLAGQGDSGAWPFVIFWLQGLLLAAIGAVWMWVRWGRLQSWLVGAPVIFAILWGLSTEVMRLLPNVY
jgi:sortase A